MSKRYVGHFCLEKTISARVRRGLVIMTSDNNQFLETKLIGNSAMRANGANNEKR